LNERKASEERSSDDAESARRSAMYTASIVASVRPSVHSFHRVRLARRRRRRRRRRPETLERRRAGGARRAFSAVSTALPLCRRLSSLPRAPRRLGALERRRKVVSSRLGRATVSRADRFSKPIIPHLVATAEASIRRRRLAIMPPPPSRSRSLPTTASALASRARQRPAAAAAGTRRYRSVTLDGRTDESSSSPWTSEQTQLTARRRLNRNLSL